MDHLTKPRLVLKRLAEDRMLLLSVFVSIIIATTLSAGAALYLATLKQLAFETSLDRLSGDSMVIHVLAPNTVLSEPALSAVDLELRDAIDAYISPIYRGQERYLRGGMQLVGHPEHLLPDSGFAGPEVARGYLQSLSNLGRQSRLLRGRMATDVVTSGPLGPELEAVVGEDAFEIFELDLDIVLTLTPALEASSRISVRIVGVIEPADPDSDYWAFAGVYVDPARLELGTPAALELLEQDLVDLPAVDTLPLFVTRDAMVEATAQANPGALAKPNWFILIDKESLKGWAVKDSDRRLQGFQETVVSSIPGSSLTTRAVRGIIDDLERRSLLAQVPMLVLMVVMVVTVLFYMTMMVSYLVQNRERDAALLRNRGANILEVLRMYAVEGLVMTGVATLLAPFLAMAIIALSGKLPYFRELTGGELLPVHWAVGPFLAAIGAGLLCLLILVIPGTAGARLGLLIHKMRSSRPPTVPFFHRYYLDVALLTFGGIIFWELNTRGHLVSGGLFKELEINETLLLAPVLFLVVVALLFMRFFPMLVRFISGESPALLHVIAAATLLVLAAGIAFEVVADGGGAAWAGPVALLMAVGAVYWATAGAAHTGPRLAGLAVQAALVGGVLALEPPAQGDVLYPAFLALAAIVPAQIVFILLQGIMRIVPVWLSMSLLHMARNPLQYSWLMLLLVLATGLGILATTVGGTLQRSQNERILYEVPTDLRVAGFTSHRAGGLRGLLEAYRSTQGISSVSLAYRTTGTIGPVPFEVLGLDPDEFSGISWYRDDFSSQSLGQVMTQLRSDRRLEPLLLPAEATSIGAWVKPLIFHELMQLWVLVSDKTDFLTAIKLGEARPGEWQLMTGTIPSHVRYPFYLVAIQAVEPAFNIGLESPGAFLIDDIQVGTGATSTDFIVIEDFETDADWAPIITGEISSDVFIVTSEDTFGGEGAGTVVFGSETAQGYRGIYRSPTTGPVPVVVSSPLLEAVTGEVGDTFIASISGRRVPVAVEGVVDYFPTLRPRGGKFMVADMESLLRHVNVLSSAFDSEPNELFVASADAEHQSVRAAVDDLVRRDGIILDGVEKLETVRLDPLITAGWRPLVFLSPVVVVLVVAFGYLAYLLLFTRRNEGEVGVLKTFGLSRLQLMGLTGFEHLTIAGVGLGLGTWAGLQASRLMVDPVAITETGEPVVPPYILLTDWSLMGPTFIALAAVLVGMLFVLVRGLSRLDLTRITRMEAN